jgi:hypothetical protein
MKTSIKVIEAMLVTDKAMTIKDISRAIKADYRITHAAVQLLQQKKILTLTPFGGACLCTLDPHYFGTEIFEAEQKRKVKLLANPNMMQAYRDIMTLLPSVHCILLYLMRKNHHGSSTLLGITNEHSVQKHLKDVIALVPLPITAHCITETEFHTQKHVPGSLAQEALQQSVILHGIESYYVLKKK